MSAETLLAFDFPAVARKKVTAAFDGGGMASDGGVLLPAAAGQRLSNLKKSPRRVFDLSGAGIFAIVSRFFATDPGLQIVKLSLLAGTSLLAVLTAASPALAVPVFTSSSPGAHTFTVATTGLYDILAEGAQGGGGSFGGKGAKAEGEVSLTAGEVLTILTGGVGGYATSEAQGAGGGGGSFVVGPAASPLVVAGGGGGAGYGVNARPASGGPGQSVAQGQAGYGGGGGGAGGRYGHGGAGTTNAAGGGGMYADGGAASHAYTSPYTAATGGAAATAGGAGGAGAYSSAYNGHRYGGGRGGFGGGAGGGLRSGGGGGGYNGGGGGAYYFGGGGGGSFLAAGVTPISLVAGYQSGNGYVSISSLTASPAPEPGSAALLGAGAVLLAAAASRRRVRED